MCIHEDEAEVWKRLAKTLFLLLMLQTINVVFITIAFCLK